MLKENYNVIGVMSGTSLDGIDLARINFKIKNGKWYFKILECETVGYSAEWVATLKDAVGFSDNELQKLNAAYTFLLGSTIQNFIRKYNIKNLNAVCSHGHTIKHEPQNGFTLQIGNLPEIASIVGETIVCDFRVQDVELGGQGAPLVPIGDRKLFYEYDYCLNLGGFSNISFEENEKRVAFDISPVNTVLNFYAHQLGFDYDDKGEISASGNINNKLLAELDALPFYGQSYPKSLGIEFVKSTILPLIENHDIAIEDKMRTFTEHIAIQTATVLSGKKGSLLITGGGAYNNFLIDRIKFYLPEMTVIIPEKKLLEFKEALIFALLGILRLRDEVNALASVTGASKDHSSGFVYFPVQ
ncbi:anhydro-N-acetylmuramic acid kinase [Flavobacterium sp. 3HN19-14]|uniref:anhydro-N-acetylmuramic acid kinase n=1 Tax=Flavobacterium sp. 3HN19-14 TaxID=3448133 RepID=UPI003EE0B7AC